MCIRPAGPLGTCSAMGCRLMNGDALRSACGHAMLGSMSASLRLPVRMLVQEFLTWEPGDGLRYELVDGMPRAMAPSAAIHGFLQNELGSLLRDHLRRARPGCKVLANPGV